MKKYSEAKLKRISRRKDLMIIIEEIESNGINVDLAKYDKSTMPFLRIAILEHQDLVIDNSPKPIIEPPIEPTPETIKFKPDDDLEVTTGDEIESLYKPCPLCKTVQIAKDCKFCENCEKLQTNVEVIPTPAEVIAKNLPGKDFEEKFGLGKVEYPKPKKPKVDWVKLPENTLEQWVKKMYWKHLGREPDNSGLQNYVTQLKMGGNKDHLEGAISSSDEAIAYRKKRKLI